jgi:hypothetical protein
VHEWGGTYRRDPLRRERGESRHAQGGPVRPKGRGGWVSELLSFFFFYFWIPFSFLFFHWIQTSNIPQIQKRSPQTYASHKGKNLGFNMMQHHIDTLRFYPLKKYNFNWDTNPPSRRKKEIGVLGRKEKRSNTKIYGYKQRNFVPQI